MNFDHLIITFHRWTAVLLILSSTKGLPTGDDKKAESTPDVIFDKSVYEAIEEIITCALNGTLPLSDDKQIASDSSNLPAEDDQKPSPSDDFQHEFSGSPVIVMNPSILEAIKLSVQKNLPYFLPTVKDDEQIVDALSQNSHLSESAPSGEVHGTSDRIPEDEKKKSESLLPKSEVEKRRKETGQEPSQALKNEKDIVPTAAPPPVWSGKSFAEILRDETSFASTSHQRNSMTKPISSSSQPEYTTAASTNSSAQNLSEVSSRSLKYRLIILPKSPEVNVFKELDRLNINLRSYGVSNYHIMKRSKSLAAFCPSEEEMEKLQNAIMRSEQLTAIPQRTDLQHEARLLVPKNITEAEITDAVMSTFNDSPSNIIFLENQREREAGQKMALLYVNNSLYHAMEKNPDLAVGPIEGRIDTEIRLGRCKRCRLLGHREKHCTSPQMKKRPFPSSHEKCIDCVDFNERQRRIHRNNVFKLNDENHPTDADECPSKQFYLNAYIRSRGYDQKE